MRGLCLNRLTNGPHFTSGLNFRFGYHIALQGICQQENHNFSVPFPESQIFSNSMPAALSFAACRPAAVSSFSAAANQALHGVFQQGSERIPASRQPSLKRCNQPIFGSICPPIFISHHLPGIPGFLPQQNANKGFAKNTCRPPSILISYFYPFYQQIVSKKHDIFVK